MNFCRLSYGKVERYNKSRGFGFIKQIYPALPSKELVFFHSSRLSHLNLEEDLSEISEGCKFEAKPPRNILLWYTKEDDLKGLSIVQCWSNVNEVPVEFLSELTTKLLIHVYKLNKELLARRKASTINKNLSSVSISHTIYDDHLDCFINDVQFELENEYSAISYTAESDKLIADIYASETVNISSNFNINDSKLRKLYKKVYACSDFDLSFDERYEICEWVKLYYKLGNPDHYEVNNYITNQKLWDSYMSIRSYNDHGHHKNILGITPRIFKAISEILGIKNCKGHHLTGSRQY